MCHRPSPQCLWRRRRRLDSGAFLEADLREWCENQPGNLHSIFNYERIGTEIYENDVDLAVIIGVERAGRVEHRNAVVQRELGKRPDLAFDVRRQPKCEAGGDHRTLTRLDGDW